MSRDESSTSDFPVGVSLSLSSGPITSCEVVSILVDDDSASVEGGGWRVECGRWSTRGFLRDWCDRDEEEVWSLFRLWSDGRANIGVVGRE